MKIPLSWLKEYIDLNLPPQQIAKMLTGAGIEVDAVETLSLGFENVVVGHVTSVGRHPNADNLVIAKVTDGNETYQVVCGAQNCKEGMKTALALLGATLHDATGAEFKIKKTKLRGIESFGMLCSGAELGLSDDVHGIMEFDEHIKVGTDLAELYADTVFDVSLTPNLNHCASVIGVARELSAITGQPLKYPKITVNEDAHDSINGQVKVSVENWSKCPRYACRLIKNVDIRQSPDWLKKRLEACGLRPINNVVDVTNYVLLEMGHPLHAFDYDRLEGHEIIVRAALEGESFVTLDDKKRTLSDSDLMICDKSRPVAIAGVMGGKNSEVGFSTKNILIESAYFQPASIRRTSKRLGLQSDASKRFERGADPNAVLIALDRTVMLLQTIASGVVSEGVIDVKEKDFPEKHVTCRLSRINSLLGTRLSMGEVESIFNRLQFHSHWNGQDTFSVRVPTYRVDIFGEIDLIEEVARIYGFDNIPKCEACYSSTQIPHSPIFLFEREVRSTLLAEGLQEFLTCDLIGPSLLNIIGEPLMPEGDVITVLNPVSIEQSVLRTSLLPGLLQVVKYNFDHQIHDISGCEVGRIHFKDREQYTEQYVAGIVLTGKTQPHHWDQKPLEVDFYDLKGIIENILKELRVENVTFKKSQLSFFHTGRQASIFVDQLKIGTLGEVHPSIQRRLDVPQRIYFAELNLHDMASVRQPESKMKALDIYPSSERDWTVTLPEQIPIENVLGKLRSIPSNLLECVDIFDIYRSEKLGTDKKNATFHFIYRDKQKTVEQEEVETEHQKIIKEALSLLEK